MVGPNGLLRRSTTKVPKVPGSTSSRFIDRRGWTIHRQRAWIAPLSGRYYDFIDFSILAGRGRSTEDGRRLLCSRFGAQRAFGRRTGSGPRRSTKRFERRPQRAAPHSVCSTNGRLRVLATSTWLGRCRTTWPSPSLTAQSRVYCSSACPQGSTSPIGSRRKRPLLRMGGAHDHRPVAAAVARGR